MKSPKKVFVCSECGGRTARWLGKCPACGAWNTLEEEVVSTAPEKKASGVVSHAVPLCDVLSDNGGGRIISGIGEFDRVLGGGIVEGSVILIAGEPGIGKSTLLLQLCGALVRDYSVLYVSGEESCGQLRLRAERLGIAGEGLFIQSETDMGVILEEYTSVRPDVMIVDSIQTAYTSASASSAGSVSQIRECTALLIERAKADRTAVFIVGHVNKEGGIAGPKVLEHMVDAVLYFEGERTQSHRIVRAVKNRFGSTNEIGVFDMTGGGLLEVENPSEMLMSGRPSGVSGSCPVSVMEGTRPVIAEIQALVTPAVSPAVRRVANGIDYNRMFMLLAVLEKRLSLKFSSHDVYLNVVGGLRIDDPAADAAVVLALISSLRDVPLPEKLIALGEVGLAGEVRSVTYAQNRAAEAVRLGYSCVALPSNMGGRGEKLLPGAEVIRIRSVYDLLMCIAGGKK